MSRPGSYFPIFIKYFLSIANSPPAMVGDLQHVTFYINKQTRKHFKNRYVCNICLIRVEESSILNIYSPAVTLTLIKKYKCVKLSEIF